MSSRRIVVTALAALTALLGACDDGAAGDDDGGPDAGPDAGPDPSEAVYDPTHIVEVDIELPAADWNALRVQTRNLNALFGANCLAQPFSDPFTYFRGTVTVDGQRLTDVGVRKKGFLGSLDGEKPSIKLKFDEYIDRRFAGLKTLTLNNSKQDPSFLRQCLSYQTFTAAGVPASRCNFAHVRVNGVDLGIFVNVEAANKDLLRRHFDDEDGNLYEGTLSDFRPGWTGTFELKTNELVNDRADLDAMVTALQLPDSQLLAGLEPIVDVDNFLTYWAAETLITHWDGYTGNANNFYAYHDPISGRFQFLPWGVDGTLAPGANPFGGGGSAAVQATSLLPRRLYQLPATRDRYVARLRALLEDAWDEDSLLAEVDRVEALITPVAAAADRVELATAIDLVRDFVTTRRAAIDADLAGGPPVLTAPLRDQPCFEVIGNLAGTFSTRWGTAGAPNPFTTGSGTLTGTVSGAALQVTQVGATSGVDPEAVPAKNQVAMIASLADGTAAIVVFQIEPSAFAPNVDLAIDWGTVIGVAYRYTPATNTFALVGLIGDGTLHLGPAGTTSSAVVSGSFSGNLIRSPF